MPFRWLRMADSGSIGVACVDGSYDALMFIDQVLHGRGLRSCRLQTRSICALMSAMASRPAHIRRRWRSRYGTARPRGGKRCDRAASIAAVCRCMIPSQLAPRPGVETLAGPPRNGGLDGLAHETRLHHLPRRNPDNNRAAIGTYFDELGFAKRDQAPRAPAGATRLDGLRSPVRKGATPGRKSRRMIASRRSRST